VDGAWTDIQGRITWSITRANKLAGTIGDQRRCLCPSGASPTRAVEAGFKDRNPVQRTYQGEWQSTLSAKLLVEVGRATPGDRTGGLSVDCGDEWSGFATVRELSAVDWRHDQQRTGRRAKQSPVSRPGSGRQHQRRRPLSSFRGVRRFRTGLLWPTEMGRHLFKTGIEDMSGYAISGHTPSP
jgi:hypothetical protein